MSDPQKASFILIPGAGGMAWYWHQVVRSIERAGHEAIAVDLPADDENAGLMDYADIVVDTIGERTAVILIAQSLGGFTAPLVCARSAVRMLVLVNAMIPRAGETAGDWWDNTGAVQARLAAAGERGYSLELDVATYFLHDVPESLLRAAPPVRNQAESVFKEPCRFRGWPRIPIHVIASADDRFFPLEFQTRVAKTRLHKKAAVVPGGHLVALANPEGLTKQVLGFER
jgi:pimeloyl-ACP methyl ester carboxylesterase